MSEITWKSKHFSLLLQTELKPGSAAALQAAVPGLTDELVEEMKVSPLRQFDPSIIQEPTVYRLYEVRIFISVAALLHLHPGWRRLLPSLLLTVELTKACFLLRLSCYMASPSRPLLTRCASQQAMHLCMFVAVHFYTSKSMPNRFKSSCRLTMHCFS